jgi:hypothetical protein
MKDHYSAAQHAVTTPNCSHDTSHPNPATFIDQYHLVIQPYTASATESKMKYAKNKYINKALLYTNICKNDMLVYNKHLLFNMHGMNFKEITFPQIL